MILCEDEPKTTDATKHVPGTKDTDNNTIAWYRDVQWGSIVTLVEPDWVPVAISGRESDLLDMDEACPQTDALQLSTRPVKGNLFKVLIGWV